MRSVSLLVVMILNLTLVEYRGEITYIRLQHVYCLSFPSSQPILQKGGRHEITIVGIIRNRIAVITSNFSVAFSTHRHVFLSSANQLDLFN